jgi:hypothetical protein
MASFEVTTEQARPGRILVRLAGEFDLAAFEEVDTLLATAQMDGAQSIVVDSTRPAVHGLLRNPGPSAGPSQSRSTRL